MVLSAAFHTAFFVMQQAVETDPAQEVIVLNNTTIGFLLTGVVVPTVSVFIWLIKRSVPAKAAIESQHALTRKAVYAVQDTVLNAVRGDIAEIDRAHEAENAERNREARQLAGLNAVLEKTVSDIKDMLVASGQSGAALRDLLVDRFNQLEKQIAELKKG